jgi:hypothetical protein
MIGWTLTVMMELFLSLERESRKMGLIINGDKTKYVFAGKTNNILPSEMSLN